MTNIKFITDSTSSIPQEFAKEHDNEVIPVCFSINDVDYNPLEMSVTKEEFFEALNKKVKVKTNSAAPDLFYSIFEKYAKEGTPVIFLGLSSGLSGSYNNSLMAKNMIMDDYPDAQIECIDSLSGSTGELLSLEKAIEFAKEGLSVYEIKEKVDALIARQASIFTIGSLYHLYKGGRLSAGKLAIGSLLRLKPVVYADKEGKLASIENEFGKKRALQTMLKMMLDTIDGNRLYLSYTDNEDEALRFKEQLLEAKPDLDISFLPIDFTMNCHCGPGTIAMFYFKKN
ncbi:MAG: DegV family protein [Bacilli bacterium]|nr:DegV family protein [Bacilli bacterium]